MTDVLPDYDEEDWVNVFGFPIPMYGLADDWEPETTSTYDPEIVKHLEILCMCYEAATLSSDTSTQLGVVLSRNGEPIEETLSCNSFVQGWDPKPEDYERPRKYSVTEHAERRAIYQAAKHGIATKGLTMYASWAACADCARAIVEAGIVRLVRHLVQDEDTKHWNDSIALGDKIMRSGGVDIIDITGYIPNAPKIIRGGKTFYPGKYV